MEAGHNLRARGRERQSDKDPTSLVLTSVIGRAEKAERQECGLGCFGSFVFRNKRHYTLTESAFLLLHSIDL